MQKTVKIGKDTIGRHGACYIIAEISANHSQNYNKAKRLIRVASESGANAVKLQTFTPDTLTLDCNNRFFKISKGPWKGQTLHSLYKKAYMPWDWQPKLKSYAESLGITFFSTVYDTTSVDFLNQLDVAAYKIASFEMLDIPLLKYVAKFNKPIILSTGMANLKDIKRAVDTIVDAGNRQIILLKCTSAYPAPPEDINLKGILSLRDNFPVPIGLSDHSLTPTICIAASAMGATVIEKHITWKRSEGGLDSHFSLEPKELKCLVDGVRLVEKALGKSDMGVSKSEKEMLAFRRSLFIAKDIKKGEEFTHKNIRSIRPNNGLPTENFEKIIGCQATVDLKSGTPLSWNHIKKC
ncbi:MAG: pseudaminic acid synthase [Fibrobacteria bacterium]|nr:pseudaminic acid synthase [Fibrobacteria bacterium]